MCFRLLVALLSGSLYADVGSIAELRGIGDVIRQNTTDPLLAELALGIMSYDRVRTGNGRMAIEFEDASVLKLTEQSQIVVTEYVYKQGSKDNKLSLNLVSGTSRFITSKLNRIAKENIKLTTPSATIGVLGTEFLVSVSVLGESTIINLPKENGEVGKIFVDTEGGRVILDKPFQATVATVSMQPPTKPVTISGLSLNALDNMLLVNPPDEIEQAVEDQEQSSNDLLDTDFLDDSEFLEEEEYEDELEIDRLSIDLLSIDYLLDVITDVLQETETEVQNLGDITIEGITVGYDPEKQIYSFVEGEFISFVRQVENTVDLQLDKSGKYDLEILTGAQLIKIKVNGGGDGTIIINQSD
jgi:hypothetical protein